METLKPAYISLYPQYMNTRIYSIIHVYKYTYRYIFVLGIYLHFFSEIVKIRILFILFILCRIFFFLSFKSYMFSIIIPLTKELLRRTKMFLICNLRPNLNLSRWWVPLKIVSNLRFKLALNLNRVLADLSHGSNSLNSASCAQKSNVKELRGPKLVPVKFHKFDLLLLASLQWQTYKQRE